MSEYSTLCRQKREKESEIRDAEDANNILRDRIDRLKDAKRIISSEESDFAWLSTGIRSMSVDNYTWKGEKYDAFLSDISDLISQNKEYYDSIDDVVDAINNKITELENEIDSNNDIISWCRRAIRTISTQIENLFN